MPDRATTLKKLDLIRIVAAVDLLLLVVLVYFSRWVTDYEAGVSILGPTHGVIVVVLLYLTAVGAGEKRWGWLFPITTPIPIFALLYEARLRREITAEAHPS